MTPLNRKTPGDTVSAVWPLRSIVLKESCLEQGSPCQGGVQCARSQREYAADREKRAARVPCGEIRGKRESTKSQENKDPGQQRQYPESDQGEHRQGRNEHFEKQVDKSHWGKE